jgi:hypothetical protein
MEILLESRIEQAAKKYSGKNISLGTIKYLATLDPTPTKKYLDRMCFWYLKGKQQDSVQQTILFFERLKNSPKLKEKDINNPIYDDMEKTREILAEATGLPPTPEAFIKEGIKKFNSVNWVEGSCAFIPLRSKEEAIYYGSVQRLLKDKAITLSEASKWCIARPDKHNMFASYTFRGDSMYSAFVFVQSLTKIEDCGVFEISFEDGLDVVIFFWDSNNDDWNLDDDYTPSIKRVKKTKLFSYILELVLEENDFSYLRSYIEALDYKDVLNKAIFTNYKKKILDVTSEYALTAYDTEKKEIIEFLKLLVSECGFTQRAIDNFVAEYMRS